MKVSVNIFQSKYFYLLSALILFFTISPFLITNKLSNFILSLLFSCVILFCVNAITQQRLLLIASVVLGVIALTGHWVINLMHDLSGFYIWHLIINIFFLIIITVAVISSVAKQKQITADTLSGAICGYLLLGLIWTFIYLSILTLDPGAFSERTVMISNRDVVQHFIYYSFETLTTLGYGDILALSDVARTFSWLEAVTGQIYLAVWISQLVGLRIAQIRNR